jgi:hypothetical protein
MKGRDWNLPAMSDVELQALITQCNRMEKQLEAPHGKARRGWTDLRKEADAELAARNPDLGNP